jgi:hypothetical protein
MMMNFSIILYERQVMKPGFHLVVLKPKRSQQSKQWMHTHSPNKPRKFKQKLYARKLMAAVFWDRKGVLMVEFMQRGTTMT